MTSFIGVSPHLGNTSVSRMERYPASVLGFRCAPSLVVNQRSATARNVSAPTSGLTHWLVTTLPRSVSDQPLASTSVRNRLVCGLPSSPTYQPRHRLPTPCGLPLPSAHGPVASFVGVPSSFFHSSITPPVPGVLLIGLVRSSAGVSMEPSSQSAYGELGTRFGTGVGRVL